MALWAAGRVATQLVRLACVPAPRPPAGGRHLHACRALLARAAADAPAPQPTPKAPRRRLDEVCLALHPEYSRNVIQSFIAQGKVTVDGRPVLKAGTPVKPASRVELLASVPKYVCRAGLKLEAALDAFGVSPRGRAALDAGLSTGGFADCLLQRGAASVVGVDVGYGQVAERIRTDPRVRLMERTNLRALRAADIGGQVDLVTLDLSFISVLKVVDAVRSVLRPGGELLVLVKPQFEAGRQQVSSGGVVRDAAVRSAVVARVVAGLQEAGFSHRGLIESPIKGATSGNTEYLAYFRFDGAAPAAQGGAERPAGAAAPAAEQPGR